MFVTLFKVVWEAAGRLLLAIPIGGAALFRAYSSFRIGHPDGVQVGSMIIPLPTMEPWWLWALLFVAGYLVFRLGWLEAKRRHAQPNLYFGDPIVHRVQLFKTRIIQTSIGATKDRTPTDEVNVASVPLHNKPTVKSDASILERAHITIEFFDNDTGHLSKVLEFGRWADNAQLGHDSPSNVDSLRYRDIEPNDGANLVDIALKFDAAENCCAFDSESWLEPNLKDPKWILEGTNFNVKVIVKSSNHDDYEEWFNLGNLGEGGGLTIVRGTQQ